MNKKLAATGLASGPRRRRRRRIHPRDVRYAPVLRRVDPAAITEAADRRLDHRHREHRRRPCAPMPSARLQEVLKPLVDDGTLTQEQADKVVAAARLAAGPRSRRSRWPRWLRRPRLMGAGLDVVATTLGITEEEVRTASCKTARRSPQLAVSNGKTGQDVIDAIVAEVKTHLDEDVADGELTQEEADERVGRGHHRGSPSSSTTPIRPARWVRPAGGPAVVTAMTMAPTTTTPADTADDRRRADTTGDTRPRRHRRDRRSYDRPGWLPPLVIPADQNDDAPECPRNERTQF